jgi:hypothetical protein
MFKVPFAERRGNALLGLALASLVMAIAMPTEARVTRIVVDQAQALAPAAGQIVAYEQISGRAFGELDPRDPLNAIIQDIELGKSEDGKVRYTASFVLTKPVNMSQASGMLWHDVPNRGTPITIGVAERNFGDIGLASAWQGDNSAIDANNGTAVRATMLVGGRHWLQVPIAKNTDGSTVTGQVFGRIVNRSGVASQTLIVQTNPVPYRPLAINSAEDRLVTRTGETMEGVAIGEQVVPRSDWPGPPAAPPIRFPARPTRPATRSA